MKILPLLFVLPLLCAAYGISAQTYKEKTIFELLKVKDVRVPLNTPLSAEKREGLLDEEGKSVIEERMYGATSGKTNPALKSLSDWVKAHPPADKAQLPEVLIDMTLIGPFYDSKLEYTAAGLRVVTDFGQTTELGKLFYVPAGKSGTGFNALDKENNSRYYNAAGRLLFDRKFSYVEADHHHCYRFYIGKKCGIADSTGKIILPAEYDEAYSFPFNGSTWFSVEQGGKRFFLEPGSSKPVMPNEDGRAAYLPKITGNRYWLTGRRVYDMIKREELFTTINKEIHLLGDTWPMFYIIRDVARRDGKEEIYFDGAGNLLLQRPLAKHNGLSDTTSIMMVYDRDTMVQGRERSLYKSGIIHDRGQWLRKPVYDVLEEVGSTNALAFFTNWSSHKPGLMDASGKILIPEGRFLNIDQGIREDHFVCYNDSASLLWNRTTGHFTKLPKNYFMFTSYGDLKEMGLAEGITVENEHFLLDTNYNLLDKTAWADIRTLPYGKGRRVAMAPFVDGKYDRESGRMFFTADRKQLSFTWNGTSYNAFENVDSLAPGSYFYECTDGNNFVQVKPGLYFTTSCEMIEYDPYFKWYIGRQRNNAWGILDESGTVIVPFVFDRIKKYSHWFGTAQFTASNRNMQVDKKGNWLFGGVYDDVIPVNASFFIVEKNGVKGLVNRSGKEILPVKYDYVDVSLGQIWYGGSEYTAQPMSIGSLQGKE